MSKAVLAGELMHVSASQITTHQRCARKWWYEKVAGLQAPSSGALETGTRVHAQMEGYLLDGIEPEFPSAKKLIQDPDFPIPESDHPAFMVEEPRDYKLGLFAAGIPVKGRIDLVDGRAGSTVDIWDWKTTAQLSYGKTAEELAYNTQLIIYGKWAFACSIFNPDYVRFRHGYIQTRGGAKARIVGTQPLSRDHVEDQYESIVDEVVTMKRSAAASNAEKVPANPLACKDFGGCPFANTCTRGAKSAAERLSFLFAAEREKENEMSLKDALRAEGINPPDAAKPSVKKPEPKANAALVIEGAKKAVERSREETPSVALQTGLHLYINVAPIKGLRTVTYLEDVIAEHAAEICKEAKVADLRLVEFGKGKGYLAQALRENPPTGIVIAQSGELSDVAIEALLPLASVVVRGVGR